MAIDYLHRVISASYQTRSHKLVMIILANYADEYGESYPGVATISRLCQLSDRQVQKILADLVEQKIIDRELSQSKYQTNIYRIRGEAHDTPPHDTGVTPPVNPSSPPRCHPVHPPGEAHDTPPVKPSSPNTKVDTKVDTKEYTRARSKYANAETQKEVAREQWYKYTNKAIRVYLEVFKRPINDYESHILTRHVTGDLEAWRHTCQVWHENDHNPTNIPDLIKKYKSTLELEGNEIERATNLPQGVKLNLERMKKEGTISERGIKKVLAGELTIKSNPQGYLKLVEVKK
jgi:hypothetical protein